jgi:hypothetical protein
MEKLQIIVQMDVSYMENTLKEANYPRKGACS